MATITISLPDPMRAWVEEQIQSGQYGNTSEYLRDLIRRDQRDQARARLEAKLLEGLESGDAGPMTRDDWQLVRERVRRGRGGSSG